MKKVFTFLFLFVTLTLQAQLSFVSSNPANGATNVGTNDTLSVTFSEALDTAGIEFGETFFTNINPTTEVWVSEDSKTIYFAPTLEEHKVYFILFYAVKSAEGSLLAQPFLIQFTTDNDFFGYTVSGTVSFKDKNISPENTLVALLEKKLEGGEPHILYANISNANGEFQIEHVPNGIYYPVAVKDLNEDGRIDPGAGDVLAKGDSIVVNDADVLGLDLFLKKLERVKFARAKAIIDSIKAGVFFRNLKLFYVEAWNVDSTYRPSEWVFLFQNMMTQQLVKVAINPEGHRVEQLNNDFFNWIRNFRPLGDSLSFAAVPDSFIAKVERKFGRAFRHKHLPDSLALEVQLSLGDISKSGFWQVVPDTNKFYWGLKYRIYNKKKHENGTALLKSSGINKEEEHLFVADYKTGEEVEVTGISKSIKTPKAYSLAQNYPNPFNPTTKINYTLPNSEKVSLKVYDILGKEIKTLVNQKQTTGNYTINFDASNLPSGIYFYQLKAGTFNQVRKMMLIK